MIKIKKINAREILDSRGNPTVECDITLEDNSFGRAAVPSGASTGIHEALEIRDNDKSRYFGKGVLKAVTNINKNLSSILKNKKFDTFSSFDRYLLELDGTENKSNFGANCILALSLAFAKSLSNHFKKPFFEYLSNERNFLLPVPMINILNGGSHADNNIDFQEFMIAPVGANSFSEALRYGSEIFYSLKSILKSKNLNTNVGDEGGFAPEINSSSEVIDIIINSIEQTGLKIKDDILLSLDVASTEFYIDSKYVLKGEDKIFSSDEMVLYLKNLVNSYPIYSIEDGLAEDDWSGWLNLTNELGKNTQLVGDDLFVTNIKRLEKGIKNNIANSILIKLNQIGTLSETLDTIRLAKKNNYSNIISHRSGETEDSSIADLSVAVNSGQIKTGSITRTDRTAKYNQLLRIEEYLGDNSSYYGKKIIKH